MGDSGSPGRIPALPLGYAFQRSCAPCSDLRFEIPDLGFEIPDLGFEIPDLKFEIPDLKFEISYFK